MNIQQVADQIGVSAYTIRYYEKIGVLPTVSRTKAGIRSFNESEVRLLRFIIGLKKTGMPLEDITAFLRGGCLLDRNISDSISKDAVENRLLILEQHKQRLLQKKEEIDALLTVVDEKEQFYQEWLEARKV